jgi:hypothetical protein
MKIQQSQLQLYEVVLFAAQIESDSVKLNKD